MLIVDTQLSILFLQVLIRSFGLINPLELKNDFSSYFQSLFSSLLVGAQFA